MHFPPPTSAHLPTDPNPGDSSMDELDKWLSENDFNLSSLNSESGQADFDFTFLNASDTSGGGGSSGTGLSFLPIDHTYRAPSLVAPPIIFDFDQARQNNLPASLPQVFTAAPLPLSNSTPALPHSYPTHVLFSPPPLITDNQTLSPAAPPHVFAPTPLAASGPTLNLPPITSESIHFPSLQSLSIQPPVTPASETLGTSTNTNHAKVVSDTTAAKSKKSIHKAPAGVGAATSGLLAQLTGTPASLLLVPDLPVSLPLGAPLSTVTSSATTSNQADAGRRSSRAIIPSKRNEQMAKIGSNPAGTGAKGVEKENIPPDSPPSWAISAKNFLLVRDLGEEWNLCVMAWSELEGILGYGTISGTKVRINIIPITVCG